MSEHQVDNVISLDGKGRAIFSYPYESGLEIKSRATVVRSNGVDYKLAESTPLPYITSGMGMPEGGAFILFGDFSLREDIEAGTVGFGSGTLSEALNSKVSKDELDYFTPEDYGAVGDGVADDTAALQEAFDSGNIIKIVNHYLFSNVTVPRPCTIYGDGKLETSETDSDALSIAQGSSPVFLFDFELVGAAADGTYTAGSTGIRGLGTSTNMSGPVICERTNVHNFGENGHRYDYCDGLRIKYNKTRWTGRAGIQLRSCHDYEILHNDVIDVKPGAGGVAPLLNAYGIHQTQGNTESRVCEYGKVWFNKIKGVPSWTGIDTHGGRNLSIRYNEVLDTALGIVTMGPGGGSTADTAASFIDVIGNRVIRNPSNAPDSRAGILIVPVSSGISAGSGVDIKVEGNWIERHGSNFTGETLEGALRIQDVLGVSCKYNTIIDSYGIGLHIDSGTLDQVVGDVTDNHISTVIAVDGQAFYAQLGNEGGRYSFDRNFFYRSGGDAIAVDADVTPTSSDNGCMFGADNIFVNFSDDDPNRRTFSSGTISNFSRKSPFFARPAFKIAVNGDGTILSDSDAISSVTKGATGVYTLNLDLSNFAPGAGSLYYLEILGITGSPVIFGQSRTNTDATITGYDVSGSPVDRGFVATAYYAFDR